MTKLSRKQRDRLIRKNDIISAAEKIFSEKGYHPASIEDIAKKSEYAVGTIYLYFKSKEDIYTALLELKAKEMYEQITRDISSPSIKNSIDKLYALVQSELKYFEKNKDFFMVYMDTRHELSVYHKSTKISGAWKYYKKHLQLTTNVIKELQKDKKITNNLKNTFLSRILNGYINSVIFHWMTGTSKKSLHNYSKTIVNIFLNGVTEK